MLENRKTPCIVIHSSMIFMKIPMWSEVNIYCEGSEVVHLKGIASTQTTLPASDNFFPRRGFIYKNWSVEGARRALALKQEGRIPAASLWTVTRELANLTEQCTEPPPSTSPSWWAALRVSLAYFAASSNVCAFCWCRISHYISHVL